ncbi:transcription factor MUTE-like [Papaver somniferum]|uniref:transcription factor MUTE-like n=1 Tax=Papaver somniferum TaxID=3469 RepID=UPI000E704230|nr:transcription factor MUTE-like [Papaver somniferum]
MAHIAVERNRRKLMNEHLKVLRSLTPCFYIKRGDQASIIGGVIEFVKELHQILQSLESKKRRKSLSSSPGPSPRSTLQLITQPPISPLPLPPDSSSPFTTAGFPDDQQIQHNNTAVRDDHQLAGASCNSSVADVEAKISGSNVILRTVSKRIPGQVVKLIELLEKHSFEILHLNVSSMEDTVLHSFVIKIGLECKLSVEELAVEVQQSFNSTSN